MAGHAEVEAAEMLERIGAIRVAAWGSKEDIARLTARHATTGGPDDLEKAAAALGLGETDGGE